MKRFLVGFVLLSCCGCGEDRVKDAIAAEEGWSRDSFVLEKASGSKTSYRVQRPEASYYYSYDGETLVRTLVIPRQEPRPTLTGDL